MSAEARYFRVGLFVLVGIAAIAVFAVALGGRRLFAQKLEFETYFEESVVGIAVGSPVKRNGVDVGRVTAIGMLEDFYDLPWEVLERHPLLAVVRMELIDRRGRLTVEERAARLERLVAQGLRLRLVQSGITGLAYVDASFVEPERPRMQLAWEPEVLYVPSTPSTIAELQSAAERLIRRIESMDVEGILENLDGLLVSTRKVADGLDVPTLQREASSLLGDLRETNTVLRHEIESAQLAGLRDELRKTLGGVDTTLARAGQLIEGNRYDLEVALENLRVATENLRELSETLKTQPSLLLRSSPPERRPIGEEEPAP